MEKEPKVPTNPDIPEEKVTLEKGYYNCVYVMLHFKKEVSVYRKEGQEDVEDDPDEEEMEDVRLDGERDAIVGWLSSAMVEGCTIRRYCYMLRGGIYT